MKAVSFVGRFEWSGKLRGLCVFMDLVFVLSQLSGK